MVRTLDDHASTQNAILVPMAIQATHPTLARCDESDLRSQLALCIHGRLCRTPRMQHAHKGPQSFYLLNKQP